MTMKTIINKVRFKKENLNSWKHNTKFWLNNPLRQVEDTKVFFKGKLKSVIKPGMAIIDMGCGSGWLLEFILELNIPFSYIGLDFNPSFIKHLKAKYSHLPNVSFEIIDFEKRIPQRYRHRADIVFNCFVFFEIANLTAAFDGAVDMLKPCGRLIIFTIDYTYLILALSHSMKEFKTYLKLYERMKSKNKAPYFFQNIDLGNSESKNLKYASVLYSLDDFYKQAKKHEMSLFDYGEVVKTSKYLPKTYQYMLFAKSA